MDFFAYVAIDILLILDVNPFWKIMQNETGIFNCIEIIVGNWAYACYEQKLNFLQCFQ